MLKWKDCFHYLSFFLISLFMQHFSIHNDLISEHFYEILSNILLVILNFNPQKRQEFISFVESYKFMNKSNGMNNTVPRYDYHVYFDVNSSKNKKDMRIP